MPSVGMLRAWKQAESVQFEAQEHYQKQSARSRYRISTSQGARELIVPVLQAQHKQYREALIDNRTPWQRTHWRSLHTAYRTTPYFEHYAHWFEPLYVQKAEHLFEWNCRILALCQTLLLLPELQFTLQWEAHAASDFRACADVRHPIHATHPSYYQIFSDRCGFQAGCSAVDLIFHLGPDAPLWLNAAIL